MIDARLHLRSASFTGERGVSVETHNVGREARFLIFSDLHRHYIEQLNLYNYAPRMGELMALVSAVEVIWTILMTFCLRHTIVSQGWLRLREVIFLSYPLNRNFRAFKNGIVHDEILNEKFVPSQYFFGYWMEPSMSSLPKSQLVQRDTRGLSKWLEN